MLSGQRHLSPLAGAACHGTKIKTRHTRPAHILARGAQERSGTDTASTLGLSSSPPLSYSSAALLISASATPAPRLHAFHGSRVRSARFSWFSPSSLACFAGMFVNVAATVIIRRLLVAVHAGVTRQVTRPVLFTMIGGTADRSVRKY